MKKISKADQLRYLDMLSHVILTAKLELLKAATLCNYANYDKTEQDLIEMTKFLDQLRRIVIRWPNDGDLP